MILIQTFWHVLGFATPALGVAALLTLFMRLRGQLPALGATAVWWRLSVAGLLALAAGWALHGVDGAMLSYLALVVVQGGYAALLSR